MGRLVPEADRYDVRELILEGYRVIYRTRTRRVQILAVLHGSCDLAAGDAKPWRSIERQAPQPALIQAESRAVEPDATDGRSSGAD